MVTPNKGYIAKRYALALFNAVSHEEKEVILTDLADLKVGVDKQVVLKKNLFSASSPLAMKREALKLVLAGKKIHRTVSKLLTMLVRNNRTNCLDEICHQYQRLVREYKGEVYVVIESAEPLTEDASNDIGTALSKAMKKVAIIENKIKEGLLGGIVLRFDYKMLDCSLRNKLQKMEKALLSSSQKEF